MNRLVIAALTALTLGGCGNDREVVTGTVTPMPMLGNPEHMESQSFDDFLANKNMQAAADKFGEAEPDLYALRIAVREKRWDDADHFIKNIRQRRVSGNPSPAAEKVAPAAPNAHADISSPVTTAVQTPVILARPANIEVEAPRAAADQAGKVLNAPSSPIPMVSEAGKTTSLTTMPRASGQASEVASGSFPNVAPAAVEPASPATMPSASVQASEVAAEPSLEVVPAAVESVSPATPTNALIHATDAPSEGAALAADPIHQIQPTMIGGKTLSGNRK